MVGHQRFQKLLTRFAKDESGGSTIEFVIVFPFFIVFVLMIFENGMISLRHVMLERGLDVTVRDVRIGSLTNVTHDTLRNSICDEVGDLIPACQSRLKIEMLERDPRDFEFLGDLQCVDLSQEQEEDNDIIGVANNTLMVIRACARYDPILPTGSWLGKKIADNTDPVAAGTYFLVATSAFVVEPFTLETDDT